MLPNSYVFDIGNSRLKVGQFKDGRLVHLETYALSERPEKGLEVDVPSIISSVNDAYQLDWVNFRRSPLIFDRGCALPIALDYETPETLGLDRIAGAIGAWKEFQQTDVLLIDAGTCINYDFISAAGVYKGGVISPGLKIRFRSMHDYTGALPDLSESWQDVASMLPGTSTIKCMHQGVLTGILSEMEGFISFFKKDSQQMSVILTGGDAYAFESSLGEGIFVRPKIVLEGLNLILEHNVAL